MSLHFDQKQSTILVYTLRKKRMQNEEFSFNQLKYRGEIRSNEDENDQLYNLTMNDGAGTVDLI